LKLNFSEEEPGTVFNHKSNEEILEGLKVEPDEEKLKRHKSNWPRLVT
jgi:hypothetical protein